jgi:hypothetical protein
MKLRTLPVIGAFAMLATAASVRGDVMISNLGEAEQFRAYDAGLSAGTFFTTGPGRVSLNSVTLEHQLYDPANPPQHFQVRLYQPVFQAGSSSPTMQLVTELGNPMVDPAQAGADGVTTFLAYSPQASVTLEAATMYAITIGEPLDGSIEASVAFTPSASFSSGVGWVLDGDVFGFQIETNQLWGSSNEHLKFKVDASPALNARPDISNAYATVPVLWPPDGQMVSFGIEGITDPDGDPVSVAITAVQQDEKPAFEKQGPDAIVNGTNTAAVRAERLGKGNGRVYKVFFTASDGKPDGSVNGVVYITVPHDLGHPAAVDDGPTKGYYNSTAP